MMKILWKLIGILVFFGEFFETFGQVLESKKCLQTFSVQRRFSPEMLAKLCERSQKWKNGTESFRPEALNDLYTPAQKTWLQEVHTCNNLICLCQRIKFCSDALNLLIGGANKLGNITGLANLLNGNGQGLKDLFNSGKKFKNFILSSNFKHVRIS